MRLSCPLLQRGIELKLKCKEPAHGEVTILRSPRLLDGSARAELKFAARHDDPASRTQLYRALDDEDAVTRIAQDIERREHYFVVTVYVRVMTKRKTGLKPHTQGINIAQRIVAAANAHPLPSTPSPRSEYKHMRTLAPRGGMVPAR